MRIFAVILLMHHHDDLQPAALSSGPQLFANDTEAEDAVQEAYVSAFTHLATYRGGASLATWLSRIVIE